MTERYDYLVLGSGIAGLYAALVARRHGTVCVVTKADIHEANTRYAQGGIAAALGGQDSPELHLRDTVEAGAGLVDEEAARVLVEEGPERIADLVRFGVPFDTLDGEIALTREAAHRVPRILHAGGDATGLHIELSLSRQARQDGIAVRDHTLATALLLDGGAVAGARVLDVRTGATGEIRAAHTILATGGAGQLYQVTTNPPVATGDGIALAFRAGAEVMDLEFVQFHPTALRLPGAPVFLISEAVRGEGGILRNVHGEAFMAGYHPAAELAPRDVVARAILEEMTRTGSDHVLLDVTHLPPAHVAARFPQIYRTCLEHGVDLTRRPVPVSPAAHYFMGGVRTNTWAETTLPGLYACGEVACTGVHGANRLASNSLLETVVFAQRAVERSAAAPGGAAAPTPDALTPHAPGGEAPPPSLPALQALMWERAGMVRDGRGLEEAARTLAAWQAALPPPSDRPSYELTGLLLVARLVVEAARRRTESRGAHFRRDYPAPDDAWRRHLVFRRDPSLPPDAASGVE
ncbi:MAG TPA: L-aspartate oxidase [Dehalococcoidia bacterium]